MAGYWNQLEPGSTVAIQPIPTARTGRQVFDGRDSMASNCNHSQPLRPGSGRAREGVPKVDQERRPVGAASPGDRVDGRTRLCDFALGSALLWGRPVGAIPLASMAGHRAREARPELSRRFHYEVSVTMRSTSRSHQPAIRPVVVAADPFDAPSIPIRQRSILAACRIR